MGNPEDRFSYNKAHIKCIFQSKLHCICLHRVKSPIDNMSMDGIDSLHIYSSPDYAGENQLIRWTEVFFIENDDSGSVKWDPVDLSRLGETLATACCMALVPHLGKLKEAALTRIGLRVTIKPETVGCLLFITMNS